MTRMTVIGGTGYAGRHIVEAGVSRGLRVTSISRSVAADPVPGASYAQGSLTSAADRARIIADSDVIIVAASPRGDMAGELRTSVAQLAQEAAGAGVRLGVVGGAGSLQVTAGGPRLVDTPEFPEAFRGEGLEMAGILEDLRGTDSELDWFFVSPAAGFGAHNPGEARGTYRVGTDVILSDEAGVSAIGGADFAAAVVDEVTSPAHRRTRFTVAY